MSRRRKPQFAISAADDWYWIRIERLRPVQIARRERIGRQVRRVKRRAERRWTT
jgi:hypothetical protein